MQDLAAPPSADAFVHGAPPVPQGDAMLGKADLAALRNGPVDVPVARAADAQAPLPDAGLLLSNATDGLKLAWLDGVPVAWVAPGGSVALTSLLRGRYTLQWRSFLGDAWEPPQTAVVPGRADLGSADTSAR